MCMGTFAGCGSNTEETTDNSNTGAAATETAAATESQTASAENVHLDALNVYFVPSRDPEEIVTATEPLSDLLKNELAGLGYDVDSVNISVGTTYEAVGEALSAGTADVGFIPGGTYVLYDDGCDVILTATRDGLNKDSDNPADWNDGQPTEASDKQAVSYRALFIAGPSEKGQELADKVNSGEELTWDDLDSANWSVMSSSSPAGYIYPALWLQDRYGKGITDLSSAVQSDSYASAFARLASGQVDVLTGMPILSEASCRPSRGSGIAASMRKRERRRRLPLPLPVSVTTVRRIIWSFPRIILLRVAITRGPLLKQEVIFRKERS